MSGDLLAGRVDRVSSGRTGLRIDSRCTQRALQVVERRHQLPSERRLAAPLGFLRLARGTLAIVLEVGPGTPGDLEVLVALTLDVFK